MKTKIMILFSLLVLMAGEVSGQNWRKISKEIKKKQLLIIPESQKVTLHYDLRKRSNVLNKIKVIHPTDTIFILQIHYVVDPCVLYSMVWNQMDTLFVKSEDCGKTFQIENQRIATKYMMKLVSEWDINEIRKEEVNNHTLSDCRFFATRIIINGKKHEIDCIWFDDFYDIERDREF